MPGSTLQQKVSLTLVAVMAALAVLSYVTLHAVVAPAFDQLELDEARTNLVRADRAIQNDLDNLTAIAGDWGQWDDAFSYVRGEYPAFQTGNLDRPTLTNLGLNLLAFYDADDRLLWGQVEFEGEATDIEALESLDPGTGTFDFLSNHSDPAGHISGLVGTALGPMLMSSWPVVRSNATGPIAGTLVMGQFFDDARMARLRERTEVALEWTPIMSIEEVPPSLEHPLNRPGEVSVHQEATSRAIVSTGVLEDLFGVPILILQVNSQRSISALGTSTVNVALVFLGLAAVVVAMVTWLLLRKIIVFPLAGLSKHIVAIRESGDLSNRLNESRTDEIGQLADEFDKLTGELHEARRLLLDQSFKAGKADTAAEVLHNIRNAMTPMINGIDRLGRNLGVTGKLKVRDAIDELTSGECPPDRAQKMLRYLESAFAHIENTGKDAADNLAVTAKQARQVEAILADQERHAKAAPVVEKLTLDEVVDEAALVLPKNEAPRIDLNIEGDSRSLAFSAHRVGLLQVMGNLILNAYESIQRSQSESGRIALTASEAMLDDQPMVKVIVKDDGCGFDEVTRSKIFQRGFSSKDGNLSGLGLHWCANAVAGMGGRIEALSEGPGHGAEFHVLLPAAPGG